MKEPLIDNIIEYVVQTYYINSWHYVYYKNTNVRFIITRFGLDCDIRNPKTKEITTVTFSFKDDKLVRYVYEIQ